MNRSSRRGCTAAGKRYKEYVAGKPCVVCGNTQVQLHHEPPRGMGGGRSGDFDVVPLCKYHHDCRHGTARALTVSGFECVFVSQTDMREMCEEAKAALVNGYEDGGSNG